MPQMSHHFKNINKYKGSGFQLFRYYEPGLEQSDGFLSICLNYNRATQWLGEKNYSWSSKLRGDVIILGFPALRVHWCPLEWRAAISKSDSMATWQKCIHGDLSRVLWLAEFEESVIWSRPCHFQHGLLILRVRNQQNDNKTGSISWWLRRKECCYFFPSLSLAFQPASAAKISSPHLLKSHVAVPRNHCENIMGFKHYRLLKCWILL